MTCRNCGWPIIKFACSQICEACYDEQLAKELGSEEATGVVRRLIPPRTTNDPKHYRPLGQRVGRMKTHS